MAVVALSRITRMNRARWKTAFSRAGMPAWKKVESPMVATMVGNSPPAGGVGPVEARGLADAGAHAVAGVHRPQVHPQGVAADVAGENAPGKGLPDGVERRPVAAAGAEGGAGAAARRRRGRGARAGNSRNFASTGRMTSGVSSPSRGTGPGAPALDPGVGQLQLDHRVGLLETRTWS